MKLIAGTSNLPLAQAISDHLKMPLTKTFITRFNDGEIFAEIKENVRGENVYIIQSTSNPASDNLMELLILIDALRRGSVATITVVIPYFGYARQDRKTTARSPITAKLVANLLTTAGVDRVVTLDVHAAQIQGFFDIPVDNLFAGNHFEKDVRSRCESVGEYVVVSPDVGGVVRARYLAKRLGVDLAIIDKRREKAGVSEVMNVIGSVEGKRAILLDDIIDSGGTLVNAAQALQDCGATEVSAYITHGVLSGEACARIKASCLKELVITDSIVANERIQATENIRYCTVAPLLAEAIYRIQEKQSISVLFE